MICNLADSCAASLLICLVCKVSLVPSHRLRMLVFCLIMTELVTLGHIYYVVVRPRQQRV